MLSPELTKFIFNYQNDNKKSDTVKNKKKFVNKNSLKSRSIKFMTRLGYVPINIEK